MIIQGPTAARADSLPGPEQGMMFDSNLYNRITDMGLTAQDCRPVCYELDEKLQMVN